MKRLLLITVGGLLAAGTCPADVSAQSTPESRVALTLGLSGGGHGFGTADTPASGVFIGAPAIGVSIRIWSAKQFTGRMSGSYAIAAASGSHACFENPCDTRRFRDEWRFGTDVRSLLGASAFFGHVGVGVSASRVTGEASQLWQEWGKGDRRTPVGFGQIGIGIRSRRAQHTRWVEAGFERQAASPITGVYLRAGLGVL